LKQIGVGAIGMGHRMLYLVQLLLGAYGDLIVLRAIADESPEALEIAKKR
jgi:hypothetical protein